MIRASTLPVSPALIGGLSVDESELANFRSAVLNACWLVRYYRRPASLGNYHKALLEVARIAGELLLNASKAKNPEAAEDVLASLQDGLAESDRPRNRF